MIAEIEKGKLVLSCETRKEAKKLYKWLETRTYEWTIPKSSKKMAYATLSDIEIIVR